MTKEEIEEGYEKNTGRVIIETFKDKDEMVIPGVICKSHGPFSWGKTAEIAVHNAKVLEKCAEIAYYTESISNQRNRISQYILDKHYSRKHGKNAYYGQNNLT